MTNHPMNPASAYRPMSPSEFFDRNKRYWKRQGPDKAKAWVKKYGPIISKAWEKFEESGYRSKA